MDITYKKLLEKYATLCVKSTYRHASLIGLSNSKKYDELLYDNTQLLGGAIYSLFPDDFSESEFLTEVRKAELKGVLIQISRASMDEIPSGILSDPKHPKPNKYLINKTENLINNIAN